MSPRAARGLFELGLRGLGFVALAACGAAPAPATLGVDRTRPAPPCPSARAPRDVYAPVGEATAPPPELPPTPTLAWPPMKVGDAFTVAGLIHDFRSLHHARAIVGAPVKVVGYVVATNFDEAPACAVHAPGKADPPGCTAPVPTLYLADEKGAPRESAVAVMGFASNFAALYGALKDQGPEPTVDTHWGVTIPHPVPNVGAKIRLSGRYSAGFTMATSGIATDPSHGIVTYESLEYLEPPPSPPTLGKKTIR